MKKDDQEVREIVKDYYSDMTNNKGGDLESSVCSCGANSVPDAVKAIVSELPDEIIKRYYGCGSPIPDAIEGCTVLDLGCGTGRDVYAVSKLVGPSGKVIGVDMNDDQLAFAMKYKDEMAEKWGFSNVEFKKGYIEDLSSIGIEDSSIDVVISNCVINLSPDKESVFSEIRRVLKDGGVLFFSDIFSDRKVPDEINTHPLLLGECLGGCMSNDEFKEIMSRNGWNEYTIVSSGETVIDNAEIEALVGDIKYSSNTIRAVKNPKTCCCQAQSDEIAVPYDSAAPSCCCG